MDLVREWQLKYYQATDFAYSELLDYYPRFGNYNRFEKFVILNLVIIAAYLIISCLRSFSFKRISNRVMKFVFTLGPVKNRLNNDLEKARHEILA
jgi:hypothetical protein